MISYHDGIGQSSKKAARRRISNRLKSSFMFTGTCHHNSKTNSNVASPPTTVSINNEEDNASMVSALTGETTNTTITTTSKFQSVAVANGMSVDSSSSVVQHRKEDNKQTLSSKQRKTTCIVTIVVPAQVNFSRFASPILDPSTHESDLMQLVCGGLLISGLNCSNNRDLLSRMMRELGFRNDDEILQINNRFLVGRAWQDVCDIIAHFAANNHQGASHRIKLKRRAGRYIYEKSVPQPALPLTSVTIRSDCKGKARSKAPGVDNDKVVEDHLSNASISKRCSSMSDVSWCFHNK